MKKTSLFPTRQEYHKNVEYQVLFIKTTKFQARYNLYTRYAYIRSSPTYTCIRNWILTQRRSKAIFGSSFRMIMTTGDHYYRLFPQSLEITHHQTYIYMRNHRIATKTIKALGQSIRTVRQSTRSHTSNKKRAGARPNLYTYLYATRKLNLQAKCRWCAAASWNPAKPYVYTIYIVHYTDTAALFPNKSIRHPSLGFLLLSRRRHYGFSWNWKMACLCGTLSRRFASRISSKGPSLARRDDASDARLWRLFLKLTFLNFQTGDDIEFDHPLISDVRYSRFSYDDLKWNFFAMPTSTNNKRVDIWKV